MLLCSPVRRSAAWRISEFLLIAGSFQRHPDARTGSILRGAVNHFPLELAAAAEGFCFLTMTDPTAQWTSSQLY